MSVKYIRKAHIVEAIQVTREFIGDRNYIEIDPADVVIKIMSGRLMIETCHYNDHYDNNRYNFGVWIVVDEHGLSWVVTDEEFKEKYDS